MARPLIPRSVKKKFKEITQQLVRDLSQPLIIVQESPLFIDCPNCIWDSINKKSSNIANAGFTVAAIVFQGTSAERTITPVPFTLGRCPVCLGEGQLFSEQEICIPAIINLISPFSERGGNFTNLPVGKEGTNFIHVKTLACFYDLLVRNEIFVVHNNIKCEKYRPPIVRGLGGEESVAELLLQTTEAGQLASGKFDSSDHPYQQRDEDPRRKIKGPTDLRVLRGQQRGQKIS